MFPLPILWYDDTVMEMDNEKIANSKIYKAENFDFGYTGADFIRNSQNREMVMKHTEKYIYDKIEGA